MRVDRFISVNLAAPLVRWRNGAAGRRLPVLMYHSVSDAPEPEHSAYYKINTSPAVFRQHLAFLAREGYQVLGLEQGLDLLQESHPGARGRAGKPVVITFDDGFRDFYTQAFPALQAHGFSATVFLPTGFIQEARRTVRGREYLTWREVAELREQGVRFGSHTVNHPRLIELTWKEIEKEVRDSKAELEQRLGESIRTFAHPYAFPQACRSYVDGFRRLLVESGYACCATTEVGRVQPGDDPYRLKRLPANTKDDLTLFQAKLEGAYDWLALPQALAKQVKNRLRPVGGVRRLALAGQN